MRKELYTDRSCKGKVVTTTTGRLVRLLQRDYEIIGSQQEFTYLAVDIMTGAEIMLAPSVVQL